MSQVGIYTSKTISRFIKTVLKNKLRRKILGSGKPSVGAHGKPVIFLHPKDFDGTLIELEEV